MSQQVVYAVAILALAVAVFAGWYTVRDQRFSDPLFYAIAALEAVLLVVVVAAIVALTRTDRDVEAGLFVSYLLTLVLIPPAAVVWGVAEKSRWGTGVVVIGMATVGVLLVRTHDIWVAGRG